MLDDLTVLGISADYHDAAAAIVMDGKIVAAAAEERFTRLKHDPALPVNAIEWCLEDAGVAKDSLSAVAFYDKPFTTYERVLVTAAQAGPRGLRSLTKAVSQWSRTKLWVGYRIEKTLARLGFDMPDLYYAEHHQSHAASAFYPSPFDRAAILTFDGIGEWTTASIGQGRGHQVMIAKEMRYPDSLGLFYSAFTAFCGLEVNEGEYKLMGLAPYGEPRYVDELRENVIDMGDDGSIRLNQRFFDYRAGQRMTKPRLGDLLDGPALEPGGRLTQREADIAASVQVVLEDAILRIADHAHEITGERSACLSGGVALNCVANAKLRANGPFEDIWVQPASGDDGSAAGAALWATHQILGLPRPAPKADSMSGAFLGPSFDPAEIRKWLAESGESFEVVEDYDDLCRSVARDLAEGRIVGWFRGRMEFGPRALGHRSILADPRDPEMVSRLNLAVKKREGFRPFAPAVLAEQASDWFEMDHASPYMLFTAPVAEHRLVSAPIADEPGDDFASRLAKVRSEIPACTHVDNSARVQTVDRVQNPDFHRLLRAFEQETGCPVLINTSFNRKDEPIVRSPADALRCFEDTDLDVLVLENCIIRKVPLERVGGPSVVAEAGGEG